MGEKAAATRLARANTQKIPKAERWGGVLYTSYVSPLIKGILGNYGMAYIDSLRGRMRHLRARCRHLSNQS